MSCPAQIVGTAGPARLRLSHGEFAVTCFTVEEGGERSAHLALAAGVPRDGALVRIASACVTGEVFGCDRCDCAAQLDFALEGISREGSGLLTYHPRDEGYGFGLSAKIAALAAAQDDRGTSGGGRGGEDSRSFAAGALIVSHYGLRSVRLLSANERKRRALSERGIDVELVPAA